MKIDVGIITVSDRAARGEYEDLGGPAVRDAARKHGWMPIEEIVVPDDQARIQEAIRQLASHGRHLILTTGGTGVSPRDVTPEAVRAIASRELQGFGEAMRMESRKLTPHGILSRSLAAVVGNTLVICLPGKPSGAVECLGFVAPAVRHCIEVLRQIPATC